MRIARLLAALFLVSALGTVTVGTTAAVAQDTPDYVGSNPPEGGTSVSGTGGTRGTNTGTLPITGADITVLVAFGLALVVGGSLIVRSVRQRRQLATRT